LQKELIIFDVSYIMIVIIKSDKRKRECL